MWFAEPTPDPFSGNEGCVACLRPPSTSHACQDPVRIPARSPQLLSASSACTPGVRLGQAAGSHAGCRAAGILTVSAPASSLGLLHPTRGSPFPFHGIPGPDGENRSKAGGRADGPLEKSSNLWMPDPFPSAFFPLPALLLPQFLSCPIVSPLFF